jgi:pilus assembly protein CpaB
VRNWRIMSTVAAVVFAAIAGALVLRYLNSADSRAEHDKDLVPVMVAKAKIGRGTVFDQALADKLFRPARIPRDSLPPDDIAPATDSQLLSVYKGKVAAADIFAGTPLVSDEFVSPSQIIDTVSGVIPAGEEAITISLDQTHAVGGFVTPGDRVNVMLNFPVISATGATMSHTATAFLLPGITVMAVGASTTLAQTPSLSDDPPAGGVTTTTTAAKPSSLITLEVTRREAEQIVQATTIGTVWLSLNPPDFSPSKFSNPTEIVDEANLFDQPLTEVLKRASSSSFVQAPSLPTANAPYNGP